MTDSSAIQLQFKEGRFKNYFQAFHDKFGGRLSEDEYEVNNADIKLHAGRFMILPDMELIVSDGWFHSALDLDRIPDEDPDLIHLSLVKEGMLTQSVQEEKVNMEAGTQAGAYVYNGLFPLKAHFPARQAFKSLGFKFHRSALGDIIPEALPLFDNLFNEGLPIGYHARIPNEVERLIDDIFHFKDSEFGSKSLVTARGIEVLTEVFRTIRKLSEKKQLRGLHVDDYERLEKIREKLLSGFEERISLDELAVEFGISVSKLKRDFKSLFDCSVYQFYTQAKMDEAYRRLKSGKFSVMEVGYDLGYQNLSKFSEMFKKIKGISPKEVI